MGITGRVVAGANLSYDDERIVDTTLAELAKLEGFESSVLYIEIDS
jgi:precorrin-6B methylase 1